MDYKEKKEIYKRAKKIYESNDLDWDQKYHLIFSDEISMKTKFEWYDPDMDYDDDVIAYMEAFKDHMKDAKIIADLD